MKKSYRRFFILVILFIFLILYILKANTFKDCFIQYTELFFEHLFPASFPFFIISSLLIDYGLVEIISFIFPNSAAIYTFFLSMISGFPSGAKISKELYVKKKISKEMVSEILLFSHFPNPLFLLGSVSNILGDYSLAVKLLISILFSNSILFLLANKKKEEFSYSEERFSSFSMSLKLAIIEGAKTMLLIYGTSLFFYLICTCITQYIVLPPLLYVFLCGIFDLTQGVFSTTILTNPIIRAYFILFFMSFGSLSIHLQVKGILEDNSNYYAFLKGRIWGTILSFSIFMILVF